MWVVHDYYTVDRDPDRAFVRQHGIRDRDKNQFTREAGDRKPTIDKFERERGCGRKMWRVCASWQERNTRECERKRANACAQLFLQQRPRGIGSLARMSTSPSIRSLRRDVVSRNSGISKTLNHLIIDCRFINDICIVQLDPCFETALLNLSLIMSSPRAT